MALFLLLSVLLDATAVDNVPMAVSALGVSKSGLGIAFVEIKAGQGDTLMGRSLRRPMRVSPWAGSDRFVDTSNAMDVAVCELQVQNPLDFRSKTDDPMGQSGPMMQGSTALVLPVDFEKRSGMAAMPRAQGFLHTVFGAELDGSGVPTNADSLLAPLKMSGYRGREAIGGNAHLGRLGVADIQLVLSDFWGYGCSNASGSCARGVWPPLTKSGLAAPGICCEWPGSGNDWSRLEAVIANVSAWVKQAPNPIKWDIWNEPDSWGVFWHNGGEATFFELWKRAVQAIRRHIPDAQIVGPSFSRSYGCDTPIGPCSGGIGADGKWDSSSPNGTWDGSACRGVPPVTGVADKLCGLSPMHNTTMRRFLKFATANQVAPDWLSWHEWSPGLKFLPDHVSDVLSFLKATPELRIRGITINEAFRGDDYLKPAGHVAAFANVEAAARRAAPLPVTLIKTNMGHGTLDGSVVGSQTASTWNLSASERLRGIYHTHVGYSSLTGELLSLPPFSPSVRADGAGIVALASIDNATQTARLLLGVYEDASAKHWTNKTHLPTHLEVQLINVPANILDADGKLHATVATIPDTEQPSQPGVFPGPIVSHVVVAPTTTDSSGVAVFLLRLAVRDGGRYCTVSPAIALVQRCLPAWSVELRAS